MSADSSKVNRRRRKAPQRRVPAVADQRVSSPVIFGWGSHLSQRERESLKERVAMLAGIAIALVVVGILGWGLLLDNVIRPMQTSAENNKPVAQVGNFVITMGFFKAFENFENTQFNSQITTLQGQQSTLSADPKKNAAQLSNISSQIAALQSQLTGISTNSLNSLIDYQTLIQRASSVPGVKYTKTDIDKQMTLLMHQQGGVHSFALFVQNSGMTLDQIRMLVTGEYLRTQVQSVFAKQVSNYTPEVRASHILVATKNKALALRLLSQVEHGGNFAALAKKYSIDTGSAKLGGDLGYFPKGRMVAPFEKAAFAMKVGEFRLVQSQYGWHIIKLTGRKQVKATATDKQTALDSRYQAWLTQQKSLLHIQRYLAPAALPTVTGTQTTANSLTNPVQQSTVSVPVGTSAPAVTPQALPTVATKKPTTKKP